MSRSFKTFTLIILLLPLSACMGGVNYKKLGSYMHRDDCRSAVSHIDENPGAYGYNRKLNYYLDSAMVNMQCGNHEKSNETFHKAEDLSNKLWTKSISREAASFLLNDYTLPYSGEDFEKALINLFSALNYAILGDLDEALVECRRLDSLLTTYNDKYEKKNVYKEDAFGRYLSGMLYEADGSLDDAYIDYYKAYKAYEDYQRHYGTSAPFTLKEDLYRLAEATGRLDEINGERLRGAISHKEAKSLGKVVMIHLNGLSPVKKEERIITPTAQGPMSIAFPRYVVKRPFCTSSSLIIISPSGTREVKTALAEDINRIAVKNLDDRKARILVKAIARFVAKQAVIKKTTEDEMVRMLANILNTALIERADTRSWRTLPGEIYMSRAFLPEGKYSLYASSCGKGRRHLKDIDIKGGETVFVLYDTIY